MKRLKMPTPQKGFLALSAVILIVFVALIVGTLAKLSATKSTASSYMVSTPRANGAAQAGLEYAVNGLNKKQVGSRINCSGMAQQALANTKITFSNVLTNPALPATLNGDVANELTTNTITVFGGNNLTSQGRIYIDKEAIDYLTKEGNTLSGITRGAAQTAISRHADGATVSQYQCTVTVTAESPSANPTAISEFQLFNQQETAIAIGNLGHTNQWNLPANELGWLSSTIGSTNINAIDMLNPHQGFAVGNKFPNPTTNIDEFSINRFNQGSWTNITLTIAGVSSQNLHGISHLSSLEAFAVGDYDSTNNQAIILKWNGSNWLNDSFSTSAETHLYDIDMIDSSGDGMANFGLAVGKKAGSAGGQCSIWHTNCLASAANIANCHSYIQTAGCYSVTSSTGQCSTSGNKRYNKCLAGSWGQCKQYINSCTNGPTGGTPTSAQAFALQYNGTTWLDAASSDLGSIVQLNGVSVIDSANAYAAAQTISGGNILYWDGSNWSIAQPNIPQMNAISIINTPSGFYGFAVGNSNEAYKLESGIWTTVTVPDSPSNLTGVKVISPTNAWLVTSNGKRYHWDGTEWLLNSSSPATPLTGVAAVGHRQLAKPYMGRHQVLN